MERKREEKSSKININCPYVNYSDWGSWSCTLYNPREKYEKTFIHHGICKDNIDCPFKVNRKDKIL